MWRSRSLGSAQSLVERDAWRGPRPAEQQLLHASPHLQLCMHGSMQAARPSWPPGRHRTGTCWLSRCTHYWFGWGATERLSQSQPMAAGVRTDVVRELHALRNPSRSTRSSRLTVLAVWHTAAEAELDLVFPPPPEPALRCCCHVAQAV